MTGSTSSLPIVIGTVPLPDCLANLCPSLCRSKLVKCGFVTELCGEVINCARLVEFGSISCILPSQPPGSCFARSLTSNLYPLTSMSCVCKHLITSGKRQVDSTSTFVRIPTGSTR